MELEIALAAKRKKGLHLTGYLELPGGKLEDLSRYLFW